MADIQVLVLELRRTRVAVVVRGAAAVSLAFKFSNIEIAKRAKDTLGEEMTADVLSVHWTSREIWRASSFRSNTTKITNTAPKTVAHVTCFARFSMPIVTNLPVPVWIRTCPSFGKSKCRRKIITHFFKDFFRQQTTFLIDSIP
jgi:hypothetical protein